MGGRGFMSSMRNFVVGLGYLGRRETHSHDVHKGWESPEPCLMKMIPSSVLSLGM